MNCVAPNAPAQEPFIRSGVQVAAMQDLESRLRNSLLEIGLSAADTGERRGRAQRR
jgi:hypothetical protein